MINTLIELYQTTSYIEQILSLPSSNLGIKSEKHYVSYINMAKLLQFYNERFDKRDEMQIRTFIFCIDFSFKLYSNVTRSHIFTTFWSITSHTFSATEHCSKSFTQKWFQDFLKHTWKIVYILKSVFLN